MGQRVLGYPIKKQDRGHYYMYVVNADPQVIQQAERSFKLKSEILKFLFVKKEK